MFKDSKSIRWALAGIAGFLLTAAAQAGDDKNAVQSANEQLGGFFVGVQGGADFASRVHNSTGADIDSSTLALGGIKGGYIWNKLPFVDWQHFTNRVELEADWTGDTRYGAGAGRFDDNSAIVLLSNSVGYKVGKFEPYVGGGVGFINTWVDAGPGPHGNSSDISLAYGPLAGLRYNLTSHWQAFGEYKYLWSDDKSLQSTATTINTHTERDQIASAGVSYLF